MFKFSIFPKLIYAPIADLFSVYVSWKALYVHCSVQCTEHSQDPLGPIEVLLVVPEDTLVFSLFSLVFGWLVVHVVLRFVICTCILHTVQCTCTRTLYTVQCTCIRYADNAWKLGLKATTTTTIGKCINALRAMCLSEDMYVTN